MLSSGRSPFRGLLLLALAAAGGWIPAASAAGSESTLDLKYMYFWDRNEVWNHTPAFLWIQKLPGYFKLRWQQEFDAVSGASRRLGLRNVGTTGEGEKVVDGISGASRREFRLSEQVSLAYENKGRLAWGSLYFSDEDDYTSVSPAASLSWDFNDRNTTVAGSWSMFLDSFHPQGPFKGQGGDRTIQSVGLGITQILTPLSLVNVMASPIFSSGYLGHPYNPVITASGAMLVENLPDSKTSIALSAKFIQGFHLWERLGSVHLEGNLYQDDWGLMATTLDIQGYHYFTETAYLRLRARGYRQTSAAFFKEAYAGDERYRTADIRFSTFSSITLGAKVAGGFPDTWSEMTFFPDRWDIGYDQGIRDTYGDGGQVGPFFNYQLYGPDEYYQQGTFMVGLGFDL